MRRTMDECRAWVYLGNLWNKAAINIRHSRFPCVNVVSKEAPSDGLCLCIDKLRNLNLIEEQTFLSMLKKIPSSRRYQDGYVWPLTIKGAKLRAKFCYRQAAKTVV